MLEFANVPVGTACCAMHVLQWGMLYERYCLHSMLKLPCQLQQVASILTYLLSESTLQFLSPHGVRLTSYQSLPLFTISCLWLLFAIC